MLTFYKLKVIIKIKKNTGVVFVCFMYSYSLFLLRAVCILYLKGQIINKRTKETCLLLHRVWHCTETEKEHGNWYWNHHQGVGKWYGCTLCRKPQTKSHMTSSHEMRSEFCSLMWTTRHIAHYWLSHGGQLYKKSSVFRFVSWSVSRGSTTTLWSKHDVVNRWRCLH